MKKEIYLSLIIIFFIITLKSTLLSGSFNHHTFVYSDKCITVHIRNYPLSASKRYELEKKIYQKIKEEKPKNNKKMTALIEDYLKLQKCREYTIKPLNQQITADP